MQPVKLKNQHKIKNEYNFLSIAEASEQDS